MLATDTGIKRVTFRITPELFAQVTQYVESRQVREPKFSLNDLCIEGVKSVIDPSAPLSRYREILAAGRVFLRKRFDEAELNCIMDACNGFSIWYEIGEYRRTSAAPGRMLAVNVMDAIQLNGLDEKWHVDRASLVYKIRELDLPAQYALVDLIERFWADCQSGNGVMSYL